MKKTLLIAIILLSGCSIFPQTYDNNEYHMLVEMYVGVNEFNATCDDSINEQRPVIMSNLSRQAKTFEIYSKYTPSNDEVHTIATFLRDDIAEINKYYSTKGHNKFYCQLKSKLILKKIEPLLEIIPQTR